MLLHCRQESFVCAETEPELTGRELFVVLKSDETLKKAWKDVTDSKSATNWILTKISDDGKKLELVETGATGIKGFKAK